MAMTAVVHRAARSDRDDPPNLTMFAHRNRN